MNFNVLGGTLGVAALVAIFAYGSHEAPVVKQSPAPVVEQVPIPVPKPVVAPAIVPAVVPVVPVVPAPVVKAPTPAPAPTPPAKPAPAPVSISTVFHRVEQGGAQGPEIACASIKQFAEGKSTAELAAIAKQYGVSVADVQRYFVCIN